MSLRFFADRSPVWGAKISVLPQITDFSECAPSFGTPQAGQAEALREHGADVVISDLAELLERP
jgi:hypothetical protein